MGREVRRVPANWQHPKDEKGHYIGMFEGDNFEKYAQEWDADAAKWAEGMQRDYSAPGAYEPIDLKYAGETYEEYAGPRPDPARYMPNWPEAERTHWQMYENVTEGTPISEAHETPEALARELARTGVWGGYSYKTWLSMIHAGYAPSMTIIPGHGVEDGVISTARMQDEKEGTK